MRGARALALSTFPGKRPDRRPRTLVFHPLPRNIAEAGRRR